MAFGLHNYFRLDQLDDVRALGLVSGDILVWDAVEEEFTKVNSSTFGGSEPPFAISDITGLQTALDGKQPIDSDLTTFAGLSPTNDDIVQRKAGAWTNRTPAQFKTDLSLTKSDVGLGNVDNTSDADKSISTATQAALDLKAPIANPTFTGTVTLAGDPASSLQAATKQYVDSLAINVGKRARARAATTASITISTALNDGDTLDGVTLATGDLVLVKNQSATEENGVYVVGPSPARSSEFDTYNEHPGSLVAVAEGSTNADTLWLCTSNDGGTLGSTAISFSKMVIAGELLSANNLSDLSDTSSARNNLGVAIGTHVQAYDGDLAAIAGLSASNDDFIQRKTGAWTNRTVAQVKTDLGLDGAPTATTIARIAHVGGPLHGAATQTYIAATETSAGVANVTLYTVPSGKIAIVLWVTARNHSGSDRQARPRLYRDSNSYDLSDSPPTISTGSIQAVQPDHFWPLFFETDEIRVFVTGDNVDLYAQILLVDSSTVLLSDFLATSISASGTLYECPSGRSAILLPRDIQQRYGSFIFSNSTGSNATVTTYRIPDGESIGDEFIIKSDDVNNGQTYEINNVPIFLNAGDSIAYASTQTGSGWIYGAILEFETPS